MLIYILIALCALLFAFTIYNEIKLIRRGDKKKAMKCTLLLTVIIIVLYLIIFYLSSK